MSCELNHIHLKLTLTHPVNNPPLGTKTRGPVTSPYSAQGLVAKPLNQPKTARTLYFNNSLPGFIPVQDLYGSSLNRFCNSLFLKDDPGAQSRIYLKGYICKHISIRLSDTKSSIKTNLVPNASSFIIPEVIPAINAVGLPVRTLYLEITECLISSL